MKKLEMKQVENLNGGGGCGSAIVLSVFAIAGVALAVASGPDIIVASSFLGMMAADANVFDKCHKS